MGIISYSVENDKAFQAALNRAAQTWGDLRIPFALILADFQRSEESIFNLKGPGLYPPFKNSGGYYRTNKKGEKKFVSRSAFGGGTMSPYQAYKLKKYGFDYPLLVRTGRLADSLTDSASGDSIHEITAASLTIGTRVPYGVYHQSDDPRSRIPQRKFLFIGPEAPRFATQQMQGRPERWMNILNDFTLKKLKQSGAFT